MVKYYHGGTPGLGPGDFLLPPSESGYPYPCDLFGGVGRRDRVYVTTSAEDAALFAAFHPRRRGNVYEVEPDLCSSCALSEEYVEAHARGVACNAVGLALDMEDARSVELVDRVTDAIIDAYRKGRRARGMAEGER